MLLADAWERGYVWEEQSISGLDRVAFFKARVSNNTKLVNQHKAIMEGLESVHGVESISAEFGTY